MDELVRQFLDLLQAHVITLGEEPVKIIQIIWLIGTLSVTLAIGAFCADGPSSFQQVQDATKPQKSITCTPLPYRSNFWNRFGIPVSGN